MNMEDKTIPVDDNGESGMAEADDMGRESSDCKTGTM